MKQKQVKFKIPKKLAQIFSFAKIKNKPPKPQQRYQKNAINHPKNTITNQRKNLSKTANQIHISKNFFNTNTDSLNKLLTISSKELLSEEIPEKTLK